MRTLTMFLALLVVPVSLQATASNPLTVADVTQIIQQCIPLANGIDPNAVIAVTDREGVVLAVYGVNHVPVAAEIADAVSKAGASSFLSSNQEAFTTRTAGFIIQDHFPPGIANTPPGPLVGVGFSSLSFSDVNYFRATIGSLVGITGTSLSGTPGGVPLYKNGQLVGGVGVTGSGLVGYVAGGDPDEAVALAGQTGYAPPGTIIASNVLINGFRLPYVEPANVVVSLGALNMANFTTLPTASTNTSPTSGNPAVAVSSTNLNGITVQVRYPIIGSVLPPINGQAHLTQAEVSSILYLAAARAGNTRAGIRLPVGASAAVYITVVDNPNSNGTPPPVLGAIGTNDATIFSYDVAVQKARTALFFSTNSLAMSTRTVGFLAQDMYPPGIDGNPPGPFFGLQNRFSLPDAPAATPNAVFPNGAPNQNLPNGITIFPGGFPLYRNGVLIGAIGVSGDGVDQDDIISASGTVNFQAPQPIRADEYLFRGARLPYAKFPRDPSN